LQLTPIEHGSGVRDELACSAVLKNDIHIPAPIHPFSG
jgi:hypothetical protein